MLRHSRHRDAYASGGIGHRTGGADLESKPVADVTAGGCSEFGLGDFTSGVAVDVDVDGAPHADVACEQSGGALDDPPLVLEVHSLEQAVIGHLSLQL